MAEEVINLESACRGCLRESTGLQSLTSANGKQHISAMFTAITRQQIDENDGMPYQLCTNCIEQLTSSYTFKRMCECSFNRLQNYVSKQNKSSKCNSPSLTELDEDVPQAPKAIDMIDFNTLLNSDANSSVKLEGEAAEKKNKDKTKKILNDMESNKFTQTAQINSFKAIYNCSECFKKFYTLSSLILHLKWQHDLREAGSCRDCRKVFLKHSLLKKHCLAIHGRVYKRPLQCQICSKSFTNVNSFKLHMTYHGKKKLYNCNGCDLGFNKYQNFTKHIEQCRKNQLICFTCDKKFLTSADFLLHSHSPKNTEDLDFIRKIKHSIADSTATNGSDTLNQNSVINVDRFIDSDLNIKEEPLEELLEEAERENHLLSVDSNSIADDLNSIGDYSDGIESDVSEYISDIKAKRKVGRPCKDKKKDVDNLGKYHCDQCPEKFSNNVQLQTHMNQHYGEQGVSYSCSLCKMTFSDSYELKKHKRSHSSKQFKCNSCDKSFHRQENLEKHMWQHTDSKPYQCDKCSKGFMREEHLTRHMAAVHSDKKKNPKTAFCTICNRGFTTEKYLETHMRMHTGDKTYTCKICDKSFNTKWHLKEHNKWHSAEKPFLCSECGQRFIRNDYLITHMRRHNGEKPYTCKYCNKGFPRATDLTVHERYHTGEKTHLCTVCGKGFQRQYNLTVHLRVHTGEKPYNCTYCGKKFAQGNDLKSHVRRHTGERFNCEVCGEGFIQGYHLTQHKRGIHGIQCTSHIRRVEKHPQGNASGSNTTKQSNQDLPVQLATTINSQLQDNVNSTGEAINVNSSVETLNIPQHGQHNAAQSAAVEVHLPRPHAMPGLMPIMPLPLFPNMQSRI